MKQESTEQDSILPQDLPNLLEESTPEKPSLDEPVMAISQQPPLCHLVTVRMPLKKRPLKPELSLSKKRAKHAKHVTFVPRIRIYRRPHCPGTWYDRSDYARFDHDRRETLCAVHEADGNIEKLDTSKYCLRGLEECLSQQTAVRRKMHMMRHQQLVLRLQEHNATERSLRAASRLFSQKSMKRAHFKAMLAQVTENKR